MDESASFDPNEISAEEFARLIGGAKDDLIRGEIRAIGVPRVLDRIFDQMRERFRHEQAGDVEAEVLFAIHDDGAHHVYGVAISRGICVIHRELRQNPRVTLKMDLVPFVKLVTGWAEGPALFMKGKLAVSGDVTFALRLLGLFDRPKVN